MKFGKRLAAEAARRWTEQYLDYKAVKKAIKDDIRRADASASGFLQVLQTELSKVSAFYVQQADALEARLNALTAGSSAGSSSAATAACSTADDLSQVRSEVSALIKFVALNYLAVVKAVKKRNRHVSVALGSGAGVRLLHPLDILSHEAFFTSNRLAALATRAEVFSHSSSSSSSSPADSALAAAAAAAAAAPRPAAAALAAGGPGDAAAEREALLQDYQCPVCLDLLRNPVVLTCAHRFCWGCLVAHYAALRAPRPAAAAGGGSSSGYAAAAGAASGEALVVLEKLLEGQDESEPCQAYACPVCRQPQMLNIESLTVDQHLAGFVDGLRTRLGRTVSTDSGAVAAASDDATMAEAAADDEESAEAASSPPAASEASEDMVVEVEASAVSEEWQEPEPECGWLLPPQAPEHEGRLTVLLDLDGTLISSFTPKRAPRLPTSMVTHTVGVGSALNPGGVFVVERPGLGAFLRELAGFAEVAVFTAGLREYAEPIIDAIDPDRSVFADRRIYREGTVETEHYQCVKDMARVGRRAGRVVLLDDTPLAFLRQPANGIPVLGFRGDPDDRLLGEAVLPLLQNLAAVPDVRPRLIERFGMPRWFEQHNYPSSIWERRPAGKAPSAAALLASCRRPRTAAIAAAGAPYAPYAASPVPPQPSKEVLFLTDFDNTLTAWDAGERLVGELAPELAPMLAALKMPANFVPLTNQILGEMARRGLTRDALLSALQRMGAELPPATVRMLRAARARGVDVTILSDCNSTFISTVLAGARVRDCVADVITNGASWERTGFGGAPAPALAALAPSSATSPQQQQQQQQDDSQQQLARGASYKLVIAPRRRTPGACPRCPSNLCKGEEVAALLRAGAYRRIVYAGDGANDICPALALRPCDVVLARRGHALADYAAAAAAAAAGNGGGGAAKAAPGPAVAARVETWETHEELAALVEQFTAATAAAAAMARLPN